MVQISPAGIWLAGWLRGIHRERITSGTSQTLYPESARASCERVISRRASCVVGSSRSETRSESYLAGCWRPLRGLPTLTLWKPVVQHQRNNKGGNRLQGWSRLRLGEMDSIGATVGGNPAESHNSYEAVS